MLRVFPRVVPGWVRVLGGGVPGPRVELPGVAGVSREGVDGVDGVSAGVRGVHAETLALLGLVCSGGGVELVPGLPTILNRSIDK